MAAHQRGSYSTLASPVGELLLLSDGVALTGLYPAYHQEIPDTTGAVRDDAWFAGVRDQLRAYFRCRLQAFDVLLSPGGTPFQRSVWEAVRQVPCGGTTTSAALARDVLRPTASRAVAAAVAHNPILVIIPCHRVVGSHLEHARSPAVPELRRWLLAHEAGMPASRPTPVPTLAFSPRVGPRGTSLPSPLGG